MFMKELERNLKALANKRRLAIIKYLKSHQPAPVGDIADAIKLSFKATSKHLTVLKGADILESEQKSKLVFYSLSSELSRVSKSVISYI
ncbi:MAG: metalloregulator ArsR/SmtB family transcription factor [Patescibacteria group bacterium]